ncbi:unnamed protein product [Schistosoma margrebowiei]|uniref:Flocculation protein FLO11-like n=1 Tax=Schistosoma margrebowiei TaxID=48269 RepID=A0AA85AIL9_9TREM|nr:unnamed protein product [Schistosoma margrebowiei]
MFRIWIYFALIYLIHITVSTADRQPSDYPDSELIDIDLPSSVSKPYYTSESDFHENNKVLSRMRRRVHKRTQHPLITHLDLPRNLRGYDNNENDYGYDTPVYFQQLVSKTHQASLMSPEKRLYSSDDEELMKILIKLIKLFKNKRVRRVKPVASVNHIIMPRPAVHIETSAEHSSPNNLIDYCKDQKAISPLQSTSNGFQASKTAPLPQTNPTESLKQTSQSSSSDSSIQIGTVNNIDAYSSKITATPALSQKQLSSSSSNGFLQQPSIMLNRNPIGKLKTKYLNTAQQVKSNIPRMSELNPLGRPLHLTFREHSNSIHSGYRYTSVYNHAEALSPTSMSRHNILTGTSITELPSPKEIHIPISYQDSQNVVPVTPSSAPTAIVNQQDNPKIQPIKQGQKMSPQQESQSYTNKFPQQSLTQKASQISPVMSTQQNIPPVGRDSSHTNQSPDVNDLLVTSHTQSLGQQKQQVVPQESSHKPIQQASKTYTNIVSPLPPVVFTVSKIGDYDWHYNIFHPSRPQRWNLKNYAVKHKLLEQIRRVLSN